ncbi:hypothetical protein ADU37_CDS17860 [Thermococcus sp. 2319x1]|nr:hypothetical protein ADU37_CDS17860 [Thermococcus sp. 2319x1]
MDSPWMKRSRRALELRDGFPRLMAVLNKRKNFQTIPSEVSSST